jgi:hypothetical protein
MYDYKTELQVNPKLTKTHRDEFRILGEIADKLEQIQDREDKLINKEKIIDLTEKRSNLKDKKRRRTTHFTSNKHKKRPLRPMLSRKGFKGKGKKLLASKKALMNRAKGKKTLAPGLNKSLNTKASVGKNSQKKQSESDSMVGTQLYLSSAPVRLEKVRISSASKSISK